MNDYQKEQLETLRLVRNHLPGMKASLLEAVEPSMSDYLSFRKETDRFLAGHFSGICDSSCYRNQRSACCSKDGIITFFADAVVNVLQSNEDALDRMEVRLQQPNAGGKCVYLASSGCLWEIKPIVCQMFLCDKAEKEAFGRNPSVRTQWELLQKRKQDFIWPDKPVLFDRIESAFLSGGYSSSLMHLHNSPGLLRLKKRAGLM